MSRGSLPILHTSFLRQVYHGLVVFDSLACMEYVIAILRVKNLGDPAETKRVSSWSFRVVGDRGAIYDSPMLVLGNELAAELFGGGSAEGQLAFEVSQGEGGLVLIYDSGLDTEARYLSLGE